MQKELQAQSAEAANLERATAILPGDAAADIGPLAARLAALTGRIILLQQYADKGLAALQVPIARL